MVIKLFNARIRPISNPYFYVLVATVAYWSPKPQMNVRIIQDMFN